MKPSALLTRLAQGEFANVRFADARRLAGTAQRLNLQASGGQAKPYQLRQLLDLVERHALRLKEDDE